MSTLADTPQECGHKGCPNTGVVEMTGTTQKRCWEHRQEAQEWNRGMC